MPLQLMKEDVAILVALPYLHTLNISKSNRCAESERWIESSVVALFAISKKFPHLKLAHIAED